MLIKTEDGVFCNRAQVLVCDFAQVLAYHELFSVGLCKGVNLFSVTHVVESLVVDKFVGRPFALVVLNESYAVLMVHESVRHGTLDFIKVEYVSLQFHNRLSSPVKDRGPVVARCQHKQCCSVDQ